MTREEAINELEILKENYWDDDGYGHETKQYDDTMLALDMAIKALEQEPTIKNDIRDNRVKNELNRVKNELEPRWIPCSEQLPEHDVEVLVTDDAGGLATIGVDSIYESEATGEKEWYISQRVTAWMPLPKPYKEVEK